MCIRDRVIDPVQAYLGEADISNVGGMRRVLHQLSLWAARYDCAVVPVSYTHLDVYKRQIWHNRACCRLA